MAEDVFSQLYASPQSASPIDAESQPTEEASTIQAKQFVATVLLTLGASNGDEASDTTVIVTLPAEQPQAPQSGPAEPFPSSAARAIGSYMTLSRWRPRRSISRNGPSQSTIEYCPFLQ